MINYSIMTYCMLQTLVCCAVRPHPPQQVQVSEKHSSWIVKWTKPSTASKLRLYYQVCYYRMQDQVRNLQQHTH